jgi:hypothetical protein
MKDSLVAFGRGVIQKEGIDYRGYGSYFLGDTDTINSIFLDFNTVGHETGYTGISNNTISSEVKENALRSLIHLNDTTYLITAKIGNLTQTENPIGEFVIDTGGNHVYAYQNHPGAYANLHPTTKTKDNRFAFVARKQNAYKDILLYKLNADLSQADYDTTSYVYDSLCDYPITTDTIYLDNCSTITGVDEIREPQDYYAYIQTIPIHIFPNPATSGVTFELGNTEHHNNIRLSCYDINGKLVFEQPLANGQSQIRIKVSGWQSGMYIAIAGSSNGGTGSAKFLIR